MQLFFLVAFVSALILSFFLCGLALRIAPNFRSGERKEGVFRADQSLGNSNVKINRKDKTPESSELPLVGSRGMIPAMLIAGGITGYLMNFSDAQWELMGLLGAGTIGFWLVGFIDDWKKVHSGQGIRELTKFIGVFIVSVAFGVGLLYFFDRARVAYSPYVDIFGLNTLFHNVTYAWPVFFVILCVAVTSLTSLSVDFSDGLDGLCGGLMFPVALAYAIINLNEDRAEYFPLTIACLVLAGASLGFLPWNWPSSWKKRGSSSPRRARMIMGDSGSLALGGLLGMIAIVDRQEWLLVLIGGVFVIEGLSAVVQSRLLVKFFRRYLQLERFRTEGVWFPHTEFPLPFLATPLHHHYDLLGWDRRRLVYGAWTIAALFATLGVASVLAPVTWQRYLTRAIIVLISIALWQSGHHTRNYFLGLVDTRQGRRLALFYGYPYRLFGRPMYALVEQVEATPSAIFSPAEEGLLWVRTNVFDARAALGFYCYRAGYYALAREQWERIPLKNLEVRPRIRELLAEARRRVSANTDEAAQSFGTIETAIGAAPSPVDTLPPMTRPVDGAVTGPLRHEPGATTRPSLQPMSPTTNPEVQS